MIGTYVTTNDNQAKNHRARPKSSLLSPKTQRPPIVSSINQSPSAQNHWHELCDIDDTLIDGLYPYVIPGRDGFEREVIVARVNGTLFALQDQCPHRRVPLSGSAYIDGEVIYCGYHHWGFQLESGHHTLPTGIKIDRYEVIEKDGKVFIALL